MSNKVKMVKTNELTGDVDAKFASCDTIEELLIADGWEVEADQKAKKEKTDQKAKKADKVSGK